MAKVLIIHGAGMNMRGKVQIETFGTMTLPEYDEHIRKYAAELGLEVEIFHSNIVGEVINKFYEAHEGGFAAALINPAGLQHRTASAGRRHFPGGVPHHRSAHFESGQTRRDL